MRHAAAPSNLACCFSRKGRSSSMWITSACRRMGSDAKESLACMPCSWLKTMAHVHSCSATRTPHQQAAALVHLVVDDLSALEEQLHCGCAINRHLVTQLLPCLTVQPAKCMGRRSEAESYMLTYQQMADDQYHDMCVAVNREHNVGCSAR